MFEMQYKIYCVLSSQLSVHEVVTNLILFLHLVSLFKHIFCKWGNFTFQIGQKMISTHQFC